MYQLEAIFEIVSGKGNGIYTLRQFDRYDMNGCPVTSYVKNLSRNAFVAFEKAKQHIISEGLDPAGDVNGVPVLSFDPDHVSSLDTWGECDPVRMEKLRMVSRGVMPWGKHFGERLVNVPISYIADWVLAHDLETVRSDTILEKIRLFVSEFRAAEFKEYVENHNREIAERDKALQEKRDRSQHIGEVGQRIEIEASITFVKGFDGFYGVTFVNVLEDAAGNVFVYRGNELGDKGDQISLKATVKEHGEYNNVKQTVISRPKVS